MDKLRKYFSSEETGGTSSDTGSSTGIVPDVSVLTGDDSQDECCPCKMSFMERVKWFAVCFGIGCLISILGSIFMIFSLILFAIFYTLGNLVSLASTCFLMGPCKQLKRMFQETRIIATVVMFAMMALTLMAALWWDIMPLALLFCVLQFCALTWYSLSYVPFARDAVKKCFTTCVH